MAELLAEAKYYCISELAESCEQALLKKERDAEPICRVPLITSQKEEQLLISSTSKVLCGIAVESCCNISFPFFVNHCLSFSRPMVSSQNMINGLPVFLVWPWFLQEIPLSVKEVKRLSL
jgi:hypothetical protein